MSWYTIKPSSGSIPALRIASPSFVGSYEWISFVSILGSRFELNIVLFEVELIAFSPMSEDCLFSFDDMIISSPVLDALLFLESDDISWITVLHISLKIKNCKVCWTSLDISFQASILASSKFGCFLHHFISTWKYKNDILKELFNLCFLGHKIRSYAVKYHLPHAPVHGTQAALNRLQFGPVQILRHSRVPYNFHKRLLFRCLSDQKGITSVVKSVPSSSSHHLLIHVIWYFIISLLDWGYDDSTCW